MVEALVKAFGDADPLTQLVLMVACIAAFAIIAAAVVDLLLARVEREESVR